MTSQAAFYILISSAVLAFTEQSPCQNTVLCPCGSTGKKFPVCVNETNIEDTCNKWPSCKECQYWLSQCLQCTNSSNGSSCIKGAMQKKSRQRRQYYWSQGACPQLQPPKPGSMSCTSYGRQRTCTGMCGPGYYFGNGESSEEVQLTCQNGVWTPHRAFPACKSSGQCDLKPIGHGGISCESDSAGTYCDIHCSHHYEGRFYCYPGRGWNPRLPHCVKPEANRIVAEIRQPCRCQYGGQCDGNDKCVCPEGRTGTLCESISEYPEEDHQSCRCQYGGQCSWDGQCICPVGQTGMYCETRVTDPPAIMCPDPGHVTNADRLNSDGSSSQSTQRYRVGQSVAYTCHPGFALQRNSLITCHASGRWSDRLPSCIPIETQRPVIRTTTASSRLMCPDPGQVANGDRLNSDGTLSQGTQRYRIGQSLAFNCHSGFVLQGNSLITCRSSRRWSNRLPSCIPIQTPRPAAPPGIMCPDPGHVANADRLNSDGSLSQSTQRFRVGQSLAFTCYSGFVLYGSSLITCRASRMWSDRLPSCRPRAVQAPRPVGRTTTESSANTLCCVDPEYLTPTSSKRVQHTFPPEFPRPCPGPPDAAQRYPHRTRLEYTCEDGSDLKGSSELYCLATGSWTTEPPSCETQCGKSFVTTTRKIIRGSATHAGEWPWVVAITITGNSQIICGGAILSSRVVVTAAHCLRQANTFTLYFGKFQVGDDDDKVEVRESTDIVINPNYNSSTYDSDIGLVMFDPIVFTERVQPICLPDQTTTRKNLMSGKHGYVTGWGDTERARQADKLLLASLPVVANDECAKSLNLALTQNMFCAGYKDSRQSTCTGDSGSPLVFFDSGTEKYTLEGLVSFSVQDQCGQKEMYTVFTRVSLFAAWIQIYIYNVQ